MGMYDDIKVPAAYLRGILDKKVEKLFNKDTVFQTKSLENGLFSYKIHRKQLYKYIGEEKWIKDIFTGAIDFYTSVKDEKETEHWFDFKFLFKNGKLDSKEFVGSHIIHTKEEREETERMWDMEQEIFDEYRKSLSYMFWIKVQSLFQKLTNIARNKHQIPYKLREQAYKVSGRLEKDPEALKYYKDI